MRRLLVRFLVVFAMTFQMQTTLKADTLDSAKAFPNPFRPSQGDTAVTFVNLPANAHIQIFTLAGEKVREFDASNDGKGAWDGNNDSGSSVASDIYFALIIANGQKSVLTLAVIR